MPKIAEKDDPALWARVKSKWLEGEKGGPAGKWNARKAMLAVTEYKNKGGGYVGRRDPANSLKKWEKEDWGYAGKNGRYLPKKVRDALTPTERRRENALKRGRKGENISYSDSVNEKMRAAGIYGGPKKSASAAAKKKPAAAKKKPAAAKKK